MAADKKIPLLTEVYQPKPSAQQAPSPKRDDITLITPELIARVTGHVRPRLEAEITQSVLMSVRDALRKDLLQDLQAEIKAAQQAVETNTNNFVDKTKADLKTELPQMYQNSADYVFKNLSEKIASLQTDAITHLDGSITQVTEQSLQVATQALQSTVDSMQADTSVQIKQDLTQEMQTFQTDALSKHQALLQQDMAKLFEATKQEANTHLQQELSDLQTVAILQMRTTFTEAMPSIYANVIQEQQDQIVAQISQNLDQAMQAFQAQSINEHQTQLAQSIDQHQTQLAQSIDQHQTLLAQSISSHQAQLTQLLTSNFESLSTNAKDDLAERLRLIQAEAVEQMRSTLNAAIPSIYAAAGDGVKAKFADEMVEQSEQMRGSFLTTINADLPAVQEVMHENIQQILANALPKLALDLRNQLTQELQDLLLTVKFVLPK